MKQNLEKIITESVENKLNEMKLKAVIKSMLREYIEYGFSANSGDMEESKKDSEDDDKKKGKNDKEKSKKKSKKTTKKSKDKSEGKFNDYNEENPEDKELISSIEKYFKNPGIDMAPFAYKLFDVTPVEGDDTDEMKNARSLFYKKVYNELNDSGYPYQFSPEEAVSLQSAISDHELNECKKWVNILNKEWF